jgi:hypothetical protein
MKMIDKIKEYIGEAQAFLPRCCRIRNMNQIFGSKGLLKDFLPNLKCS